MTDPGGRRPQRPQGLLPQRGHPVQRLGLDPEPGVKALIVVPTRELAVQVYEDMDMLTSNRSTSVVATRSADREASDMARGVMVVGMSGVGKSSLVRAGLLAQVVHEGPLAGWRCTVMTPGDDALAALDAAMDELAAHEHTDRPALLVIDQFEEMWTQNSDDVRKQAITRILDAAQAPGSDIVPVGVLRADFYGRVVPWVPKTLENAQLVVPPMQRDQPP